MSELTEGTSSREILSLNHWIPRIFMYKYWKRSERRAPKRNTVTQLFTLNSDPFADAKTWLSLPTKHEIRWTPFMGAVASGALVDDKDLLIWRYRRHKKARAVIIAAWSIVIVAYMLFSRRSGLCDQVTVRIPLLLRITRKIIAVFGTNFCCRINPCLWCAFCVLISKPFVIATFSTPCRHHPSCNRCVSLPVGWYAHAGSYPWVKHICLLHEAVATGLAKFKHPSNNNVVDAVISELTHHQPIWVLSSN